MDPSSIKNIFWDVDGVLADLNHAYYHFLTGHPNYRDQFKGLKWEQLPEVLPILPFLRFCQSFPSMVPWN